MLGRHTIKHWSSTMPSVALSSGEAEFYGVVRGAGQGLGYQSLIGDLGLSLPLRMWTDSSAAIGICSRQGLGKLRHLDTHTRCGSSRRFGASESNSRRCWVKRIRPISSQNTACPKTAWKSWWHCSTATSKEEELRLRRRRALACPPRRPSPKLSQECTTWRKRGARRRNPPAR